MVSFLFFPPLSPSFVGGRTETGGSRWVNQPGERLSTPPSAKQRASIPWLEKGEPTAQGKCASSILAEGGWGAWLSVFCRLGSSEFFFALLGIAKGAIRGLP